MKSAERTELSKSSTSQPTPSSSEGAPASSPTSGHWGLASVRTVLSSMAAPLGMFRSLINIVTGNRLWQWLTSFKIFNRTSSASSVKENVPTEAQTEAGSKTTEEATRDISGKEEEPDEVELEDKSRSGNDDSLLGAPVDHHYVVDRSQLGSMEGGAPKSDLVASAESLDISGLGKSSTTFTVVKGEKK